MLQFQTELVFYYPIKSIGPVQKKSLELTERGLKYDRHWMLIFPDGRMISQREFPQLNKIKCIEEPSNFILQPIDLSFPAISFNKKDELKDQISVGLWGSVFNAYKTQENLAAWFSEYLSEKIFIVTHPDRVKQLANSTNPNTLNFQDGGPIHLVNLKSVSDLSIRCGAPMDPMQFRANIYLDFNNAYDEDAIEEIEINGIHFRFIKPCERCIMSTIRPDESSFNKEPLQSLSKYRKHENAARFGIYIAAIN